MNEEEQETNTNEISNLCFASGEFFVMKTMYARWGGPYRKGTTASCHAEFNNNHQKGLWEFTSYKVFVLVVTSLGGQEALNNNVKRIYTCPGRHFKETNKQTKIYICS